MTNGLLRKFHDDTNLLLDNPDAPQPMRILSMPNYYENREDNRRIASDIAWDVDRAHSLALAYKLMPNDENASRWHTMSCAIQNAWADVNEGCDSDCKLDFVTKLHKLVQASIWTGNQYPKFYGWLVSHFRPICNDISRRPNNWGAWGVYGRALTAKQMDMFQSVVQREIESHIDRACRWIPFISKSDELWRENIRGNSWLWYTYYALAPLAKACLLLDMDFPPKLNDALYRFASTCVDPRQWKPRIRLPQFIVPSDSELQRPQYERWPWNLFAATAHRVDYPNEIVSELEVVIVRWGNIFTHATLYRMFPEIWR